MQPRDRPDPPVRRRIVVLGATGRTGALIADELAGVDALLLVGRRPEALEELGRRTGADVAAAELGDLPSLLVPGDVLLSCVGPFDLVGDQVVGHALRAGATYVDVTGEPAFLWRLHDAHHGPARDAGVTLLPAVGYEYLPGVLLSELALADVADDARAVEVAYLAEGGLQAGSASGRRSLVRALMRPTTTFAERMPRTEQVAARRGTFTAGGRRQATVSLGGAEVWALPSRHPQLQRVDVHTGWFGPLGPALQVATRLAKPARLLALDRLLDQALALLADGPEDALTTGRSRFVARVLDADGQVIARREAVAGNAIVLAARLAAGVATTVAERRLDAMPAGVTDPVGALGVDEVARIAEWAGIVLV